MNPSASVKTPLMERTVCEQCDHFHRPAQAKNCACCAVDISKVEEAGGIVL